MDEPSSRPPIASDLLALPEQEEQRRFLDLHASKLDEEFALALKAEADHWMRADVNRAMAIAELTLRLAEHTRNAIHRAIGLLAMANVHCIGLGHYETAIAQYDEAAQIYRDRNRPVDHARSQVGKLGALANLGRFQEALDVGLWACRVLEDQGEWKMVAGMLQNLGIVHSRAGDDAKSLEMFNRAAEVSARPGAEFEVPWLLAQQNRSVALRTLGRFEDSLQASRKAWEGLDRRGMKIEAARARQNFAVTQFMLGRYNEALENLDEVRTAFQSDGRHRDAMLVELFTSDCLLELRRFDQVVELCHRVRAAFSELGMPDFVAQAIVNEAIAYAELGRHQEALESLDEARRMFAGEDNQVGVASTDLETAAVHDHLGEYARSLAVAMTSAEVFEAHEMPVRQAQAHLVAARAAMGLGRIDEAMALVARALQVGEARDVPNLRYRAHHLRGALARLRGNPDQALTAFESAIREVERLRGRLMIEFRVGFQEDKESLYADAVHLCLETKQPMLGLEYAERAKSRALHDLLAYRFDVRLRARGPADQPLVDELLRLRSERDRLHRRWESDGGSRVRGQLSAEDETAQVQQGILRLEKSITDLWHRLLVRSADYAREADLWTVRTETAQPYLDSDTVILEYYVVQRELVAFVVTSSSVQAWTLLGHLTPAEELVRLFWLNLRAVPKATARERQDLSRNAIGVLRKLYLLLLEPLRDALADHRKLIVVPHGVLHYLPFHALSHQEQFMLERYEISYLPASSLLRYSREASPTGEGMVALGHSSDGRLPHTILEAKAVADLMDGQAYVEQEASRERAQAALEACRAVHIAAHGEFRSDSPLFSGLALADGWLTTLDVFGSRFQASLVTLSACQTGRNVVGGGDELLGLTRAFLGAGAKSLVLSLWPVEDQSTARLMEIFYGGLKEGQTKGGALRQAQLQILGEGITGDRTDYAHPYYWAPFFLVGDNGLL